MTSEDGCDILTNSHYGFDNSSDGLSRISNGLDNLTVSLTRLNHGSSHGLPILNDFFHRLIRALDDWSFRKLNDGLISLGLTYSNVGLK